MKVDAKTVSAGLAALGVLAMAAMGVLHITTPECAQCEVDKAVAEERISGLEKEVERLSDRVESLEAAKEASKKALEALR